MKRNIISLILALLLVVNLSATVWATNTDFLFDEADLLSSSQERSLRQTLEEISNTYNAQIVVCTLDDTPGGDADDYLDYLYDSMGFGYGANHDGVLLLICMDLREYRILSNGFAGVAIDTYDIDAICDVIVSDLSDGDYADAFHSFAEECAYYLQGYVYGYPFEAGQNFLICLIIGLVVALIVILVLMGQLKTVHRKNRANDYVKSGSMKVTLANDIYLYRNVVRTKRETSSSSGSRSGGGGSRSSGGGRF